MDDQATLLARRQLAADALDRVLKRGLSGWSAGDRSASALDPQTLRNEIEAIDRQLADLDRPVSRTISYVRTRRGR